MTDLYAFRQNAVVAASAGTGKTHALVGVLLHALLGLTEAADGPVAPKGIVATTFSRRAAAEIRQRIVAELELIANNDQTSRYAADIRAAIKRMGGDAPSADTLQARAQRALLEEGDMFVGTLHGWATRLVREYASTLGLPEAVSFVDEHQHLVRTLEIVGEVIDARHAVARESVNALVAAAGSRANLAGDLAQVLRSYEEDAGTFAEALIFETTPALEVLVKRAAHLLELMTADPEFGDEARSALGELHSGIVSGSLESLCNMSKWKSGAAKARDTFGPRSELVGIIRGATKKPAAQFIAMAKKRREFDACAQEAKNILSEAEAQLRARAERDAAWSFGQVMRAAVQLLRNDPKTVQLLRESLQILVVDEFQDTSRLQAELILHAWEDRPLAREKGQPATTGGLRKKGLLLVGDRKQSIYGFRGADVSVFGELATALAGAEAAHALKLPPSNATPTADFFALRTNRRSDPRILCAANAFSVQRLQPLALPPEPFEVTYSRETEDLHAPPGADANAGRVEWLCAADASLATERRVRNGEAIAHHIRRMMTGASAEAPLRFADFAVLAANRRALDATAYCLSKAGIPFVMSGSGFYAAQEVRDAISLLRWFDDEEDTLALLEMLRGPWLGLNDETLASLCDDRGLPRSLEQLARAVDQVGDEREHLRNFVNTLYDLDKTKPVANPGTLLQLADELLGFSKVLASAGNGAQKCANVAKLKERAAAFAGLHAFLRDYNDRADRETLELQASTFSDEDDAVRLLTAHASKGLDFPIVYWTDITDVPKIFGRRPVIAVERFCGGRSLRLAVRLFEPLVGTLNSPIVNEMDEREKRRMLAERQRLDYVALTRAAHALIFVGPEGRAFPETALDVVAKLDAALVERVRIDAESPAIPTLPQEPEDLEAPAVRSATGGGIVAVTALSDFRLCPRRYELKHEYRLAEPALGRVRRELGAQHAVTTVKEGIFLHTLLEHAPLTLMGDDNANGILETLASRLFPTASAEQRQRMVDAAARFFASSYARTTKERSVRIAREFPFAVSLEGHFTVRGTLDWLAELSDGSLEIVDYKSAASPEIDRYAFQIGVYREAIARLFKRPVRAGLVFLGAAKPEPTWLEQEVDFAEPLVTLSKCKATARFAVSPPPHCRAIGCGFLSFCHGVESQSGALSPTE